MKYWFADGQLNINDTHGSAGGFLVIYGKIANYSIYDSISHDDLLDEIATRNKLDKTTVVSEGLRLIFIYTKDGIAISGCRRIDNEIIASNPSVFAKIIRTVIK